MANRTPKLDKGGLSLTESRSVVGLIVLFVAVDIANKLIEGK